MARMLLERDPDCDTEISITEDEASAFPTYLKQEAQVSKSVGE
jgi:hypothetical protein